MKLQLPRTKFCGFTRVGDIQAALELGVEAIGLNFYPKSKRYIEPKRASSMLDELAKVTGLHNAKPQFIGVFVDYSPEQVLEVLRSCPLDAIQLHGEESTQWVAAAEALPNWPGVPILRALPYRGQQDDALIQSWGALVASETSSVYGLLIDAYDPVHKGGTGKQVAWELLDPLPDCFRFDGGDGLGGAQVSVPFLLAGGLTPENVARGMKIVRPTGVDVASGIESEPGIKDVEKMKRFIDAYRSCASDL